MLNQFLDINYRDINVRAANIGGLVILFCKEDKRERRLFLRAVITNEVKV